MYTVLITKILPNLSEKVINFFSQIESIADYINEYTTIDKTNDDAKVESYALTVSMNEPVQVSHDSRIDQVQKTNTTQAEAAQDHVGNYVRVLKTSYDVKVESKARSLALNTDTFINEPRLAAQPQSKVVSLDTSGHEALNKLFYSSSDNMASAEKVVVNAAVEQSVAPKLIDVVPTYTYLQNLAIEMAVENVEVAAEKVVTHEQVEFSFVPQLTDTHIENVATEMAFEKVGVAADKVAANEQVEQSVAPKLIDVVPTYTHLQNVAIEMVAENIQMAAEKVVVNAAVEQSVAPKLIDVAPIYSHLENVDVQLTAENVHLGAEKVVVNDQVGQSVEPKLINIEPEQAYLENVSIYVEPSTQYSHIVKGALKDLEPLQMAKMLDKVYNINDLAASLDTASTLQGMEKLVVKGNLLTQEAVIPVLEDKMLSLFTNDKLTWKKLVHAAKSGDLNPEAASIVEKIEVDSLIEQLQNPLPTTPLLDESANTLAKILFNETFFDKDQRQQTIGELLNEPKWLDIAKQALILSEQEIAEVEKIIFETFLKIKFDEKGINEFTEEFIDTMEEYDEIKVDNNISMLSLLTGAGTEDSESLIDMPLANKLNYYEFIKDLVPRMYEGKALEATGKIDVNKVEQINDFIDYLDNPAVVNQGANVQTSTSKVTDVDMVEARAVVLNEGIEQIAPAQLIDEDVATHTNMSNLDLKPTALENQTDLSVSHIMDIADQILTKYGFSTEGDLSFQEEMETLNYNDLLVDGLDHEIDLDAYLLEEDLTLDLSTYVLPVGDSDDALTIANEDTIPFMMDPLASMSGQQQLIENCA